MGPPASSRQERCVPADQSRLLTRRRQEGAVDSEVMAVAQEPKQRGHPRRPPFIRPAGASVERLDDLARRTGAIEDLARPWMLKRDRGVRRLGGPEALRELLPGTVQSMTKGGESFQGLDAGLRCWSCTSWKGAAPGWFPRSESGGEVHHIVPPAEGADREDLRRDAGASRRWSGDGLRPASGRLPYARLTRGFLEDDQSAHPAGAPLT